MTHSRSDHLRLRLARALENFNPQGAHNALDEAFASLSVDSALSEVVLPCVQSLGLGPAWTASEIAQTEFAASLLETRLLALASGWDSGGSPTVVIAYAGEERHTLGGITFGLALRDRGWRIAYLGASTSATSAIELADGTGALVIVLAARDASAFSALREPLRTRHAARHLVIAGEGATSSAARDLGAELLPRHPILAAQELHRRLGSGARRQPASATGRAREPAA